MSEEAAIYHAQMRQAEDERDDLASQLTAAQERTRRIVEAGDALAAIIEGEFPTAYERPVAAYREAVGGES